MQDPMIYYTDNNCKRYNSYYINTPTCSDTYLKNHIVLLSIFNNVMCIEELSYLLFSYVTLVNVIVNTVNIISL